GSQIAGDAHAFHEMLNVPQHGIREGREVEILAKERLRRDGLRDLDEGTLRAKRQVERIRRFGHPELVRGEEGVGQRHLSEREEQPQVVRPAQTTDGRPTHERTPRNAWYHEMVS